MHSCNDINQTPVFQNVCLFIKHMQGCCSCILFPFHRLLYYTVRVEWLLQLLAYCGFSVGKLLLKSNLLSFSDYKKTTWEPTLPERYYQNSVWKQWDLYFFFHGNCPIVSPSWFLNTFLLCSQHRHRETRAEQGSVGRDGVPCELQGYIAIVFIFA